MATTCADMLKKLQRVDLPLLMAVAMEDTASEAVSNQKQQLQQGVRSDDTSMPDYSITSVIVYGKPPGPIRLYDTGDFYRGILFDVRQDIFILESADSKTTMLKDRYGPDILGLGTEAKNKYILTLRPVFVQRVRNELL